MSKKAFAADLKIKYSLITGLTVLFLRISSYALQLAAAEGDITEIGEFAIQDCDSLTSMVLSETLKRIVDSAFAGCEDLNLLVFKGLPDAWSNVIKGKKWNSGYVKIIYEPNS